MELPRRQRGDELIRPGEMVALRKRLRRVAPEHDLTTVIACAFDHRTRMLPFFISSMKLAPAGARAVGAAMADAGFDKTRIVLQQWNRRFRPSAMKLDGRTPDIFMVSSMQIHSASARELIYDACGIDLAHRPLIIAGGPKAIYEPWDLFSHKPDDRWGADLVCTGEEFVLLSAIEVLLSLRGRGESMRSVFIRARNSGMLDDIPGLVYARTDTEGVAEELVDTGVQRLVGDLDELPHPSLGYKLLEPPSKKTGLAERAIPADRVRKHSPLASLILTFGCRFGCPYCPIPAYNQRQFRVKSGPRVADEMRRLNTEYGIRYFFGTDDNFFNNKDLALNIAEAIARAHTNGSPLRRRVRWATEVTVHDTIRMKDHLELFRTSGLRGLWLGVEDMTASLIKKGQTVDSTTEAFRLLMKHGIYPMPMMMHHDGQPLYTPHSSYGLINQVALLRKAGAISMQVLMISPATGSKLYEEAFTTGLAYESVGRQRVQEYMVDGNYVVASRADKPWRKQLSLMIAYLYFYNPLRFAWALVRPKSSKWYLADALMQLTEMWGLAHTIRRTIPWAYRLWTGKIRRHTTPPASKLPIKSSNGGPASHLPSPRATAASTRART